MSTSFCILYQHNHYVIIVTSPPVSRSIYRIPGLAKGANLGEQYTLHTERGIILYMRFLPALDIHTHPGGIAKRN